MLPHLDGWDYPTLLELAAFARYGLYPDAHLLRSLRQRTGLLPPQEISPLTVSDLKRKAPRAKEFASWSDERAAALGELQSSSKPRLDDEHVLVVWPARAKTDLSIRRTRFRDCYTCYRMGGQVQRFWDICRSLAGFDIISVCNILNASWILSDDTFDWFWFWSNLGAFDSDIAHYGAVAKYVNDTLKKYPSIGIPKLKVVECAVMAGYRNPPFPGFDAVEETRKLAEGGGRHGLVESESLATFTAIAERALDAPAAHVGWQSFHDYVVSADWETGGSSSVGKVEWEYAGESGKFKARKNLVPDVVDLEELASDALKAKGQVNVAIIKSELAKLRMAVASDVYTYLKMSWLTRFMGGAYKKWPGSTIEEDVFEQTDRMIEMLKAIAKAWNLPFDYAAFDHQPNTDELKVIVRVMLNVARRNVSADHVAEFDAIAADVVAGFDRSTLSVTNPEGGGRSEFRVTGGVMSGLRWTTLLGNGWNTVMTTWVLALLEECGIDVGGVRRWIRGDDSAIVTSSYAQTLLFRLGYEAVGALGSDGKFGIHRGASEFLRVWYDVQGCRGYAARAVPGLLQRKPWSSAPWEEESTMANIYDTITILRRRGCDERRLLTWWGAVKQVWSQRNHVSTVWLQVPKQLGGLGVEPWDGRTFVSAPWPRTDTLSLVVKNQTPWRAERIQAQFASFYPLNSEEAAQIARQRLAAKVASDDVPSLNRLYRDQAEKPSRVSVEHSDPGWNVPGVNALKAEGALLASVPAQKGALRAAHDSFHEDTYGLHRHLAQRWADVSEAMRVRGERNVLRRFASTHPDFVREVRRLERRGLARWEALDWTFGSVPLNRTSRIHPALTGLLHKATVSVAKGFVNQAKLRPRQLTQLVAQASSALEKYLCSSELSRVVYSW